MDNSVYGNTKGQTSPTSPLGYESSTSPQGNLDQPINPLLLAWSSGATFIGQGFSGDIKHLEDLIIRGIQHDGFSLINVFSPCVVFNKAQGYDFYKEKINYQALPAETSPEFVTLLSENPFTSGVLWQNKKDTTRYEQQKVVVGEVLSYLKEKII